MADISPPSQPRKDYDTQIGHTTRAGPSTLSQTTQAQVPAALDSAQGHEIVAEAVEEVPTDSHALAQEAATGENVDERGYAQRPHYESPNNVGGEGGNTGVRTETEVKDLGWHEKEEEVPNPLVGGLPNEELWTLVRRFNKVSNIIIPTMLSVVEQTSMMVRD